MTTIANRLAARWNDFLFRPEPATDLAVCRFIYYLGILWVLYLSEPALTTDAVDHAIYPDSFDWPISVFKYIPIASAGTLLVLHRVVEVALVLAAVGFATRVASIVVGVLMFYLISLDSQNGKLYFYSVIPVVLTGLLMLARSGDALSVDSWIKRRWARWPFGAASPDPSASYRWQIQICRLYVVMVYCLAGLSKLRDSGVSWALSDNLPFLFSTTMQNQACIDVHGKVPELSQWLAHHATVCRLLAVSTLVVELGAPLALREGVVRYLVIAALLGMNFGFFYMSGVDFIPLMFGMCFFVPWGRLGARLHRIVRPATS